MSDPINVSEPIEVNDGYDYNKQDALQEGEALAQSTLEENNGDVVATHNELQSNKDNSKAEFIQSVQDVWADGVITPEERQANAAAQKKWDVADYALHYANRYVFP
jgi:hypothetical protein